MEIVTKENFKTEVLESPIPVLVDFYGEWCSPCRTLAPILHELSAVADGKYKIVMVDCDESRDLVDAYGISGLPTLLLFKDGKVTEKLVGLQNKSRLLEVLSST